MNSRIPGLPSSSSSSPDVPTTSSPDVPTAPSERDRRDSRWDEHRRQRREQLVKATLAAVSRYGADVGMDEIAAEAGTSKTVVYRHFADQAELYLAVSTQVAADLLPRLGRAVRGSTDPHGMVAAAIETYLAFVEADPEVYRFVVHGFRQGRQPGPVGAEKTDPIDTLSDVVGHHTALIIADALRLAGRDPVAAEPWGHGLVGLVRSAADWWLQAGRPMPRTELAAHLTDLTWSGLCGVISTLEISTPEEHR